MIAELQTLAAAAVMQRVTLLLNHVIATEPAAVQRLLPHAGRRLALRFEGWPSLLPPLPGAAFVVTPAGLLEWCEPGATTDTSLADLSVTVDASNPALAMAQAIAGERPRIDIAGDAALAADVNWLFDHLRWDVEDDLARVVGAGPAHQITRLGQGIGAALRDAVRTLTRRGRPPGDGTSSPQ